MELFYTKVSRDFHDIYFNKYLSLFPKHLEEKIKSYSRWQDAQSSQLGYLLVVKKLLSGDLKKISKIKYNKYGKPYINDGSFFNLSHSGRYVVFVSSQTGEVGIDIEKMNNNIQFNDFLNQMTEKERNNIKLSNKKNKTFFEYWTKKEAVIKACGKGLSIPLNSFQISNDRTYIEKQEYFVREISINNRYKCHISSKIDLRKSKVRIEEVDFIKTPLKF